MLCHHFEKEKVNLLRSAHSFFKRETKDSVEQGSGKIATKRRKDKQETRPVPLHTCMAKETKNRTAIYMMYI